MPEINYKELKNYLKDLEKQPEKVGFARVYLIYGEELLYKEASEALLDVLLPVSDRSLNYEPIDGADENIHEAIEKVNTYSLLSGTKVIAINDSKIFYAREDDKILLQKAKEAYDNDDLKKSAGYFLSLLGLLSLSLEDVNKSNIDKSLKIDSDASGDDGWLNKVLDYCKDNGLTVPARKDNSKVLQSAIEKGFPEGNHLIITTDMVDKRRTLFNSIKENGMIIDCSVPKGERRAEKKAQEAVINEKMREILVRNGKTMDKGAYLAMYEMTGFDLRTFSSNLEKLVSYAGDRKNITVDDVKSVLQRTKKDPIFELSGAISDKDTGNALFYLDSLLSTGFHPLQTLAAITNQIRRLLLIKGFVESPQGSTWRAGSKYYHFQKSVMPAIIEHDKVLANQVEEWESMISKDADLDYEKSKKRGKKKKSELTADLLIVKSANNPYPVYQLLLKSDNFTKEALILALESLSEADRRLKSTGQNPKLILEDAIIKICR